MTDLLRFSKETEHIQVNKNGDIVFISENAKKIKNAYISFLPSELIIKTVEINNKIKDSLIESVIRAKLSKDIKEDFVFIYYPESNSENVNTYKAEVVLKKEVLNITDKIKTKNIELITTDYHALFAISKKYFENSFISVYLTKENIIYSGGKEKLEFFRSVTTPESAEEIADDINRTVIYFKQQTKNPFLNILLSGETEFINSIYDKIKAEVSQPLSIVKNMDNERFNRHFLLFGTLFSKENFLPDEIKTYKTFKTVFLFTASLLLLFAGYLGYQTYQKKTALTKNETKLAQTRQRFVKLKNETKLLSKKSLDYYLRYIKLQKESQKAGFLSQLNKTKPVFKYFLPYSVSVDENIRVSFRKKYPTFKEMILQKEEIEKTLKNLNLKYFIKPDYETKRIELTIILKRLK